MLKSITPNLHLRGWHLSITNYRPTSGHSREANVPTVSSLFITLPYLSTEYLSDQPQAQVEVEVATLPDSGSHGFPFSRSTGHRRVRRGGIYDECCKKSCSYAELKSYCEWCRVQQLFAFGTVVPQQDGTPPPPDGGSIRSGYGSARERERGRRRQTVATEAVAAVWWVPLAREGDRGAIWLRVADCLGISGTPPPARKSNHKNTCVFDIFFYLIFFFLRNVNIGVKGHN